MRLAREYIASYPLIKRIILRILVCASIGLAGCQPGITPEARPDPLILTLQMTPALDRLRPAMRDCAEEEGIGLAITSLPAPVLDPLEAGLALRWGAPADTDFYAAELAQETLVFIVHRDNPFQSISAAELLDLYTGRSEAWPGSNKTARAWAYPGGDDVQQAFENALLAGQEQEDPSSGPPSLAVFMAPDPAIMLQSIALDEQAVGFVPSGWLDEQALTRVRALPVTGLEEGRLNQPVLALSPAEPQQPARGWLLCLQDSLN